MCIRDSDKITVTGSRIRQVDVETTQPVTIIDRAQIEKQGFQSVSDILQNITATGTPPISRASPSVSYTHLDVYKRQGLR